MKKEWAVLVPQSVEKRVRALPKPERERITTAINGLTSGPYDKGKDIKRLAGRPEWRLRVGVWRILFIVDEDIITITVVSVAPRGDAYK